MIKQNLKGRFVISQNCGKEGSSNTSDMEDDDICEFFLIYQYNYHAS